MIKQKVWTPLGGVRMVETIRSDGDHIGNRIAEGEIHRSMYWPLLARAYLRLAAANRSELIDLRNEDARGDYSSGWVGRWLDFHGSEWGA